MAIEGAYARGLELGRSGRYFEAHEAFEEAWREAAPGERDFFQGLVHVVVAWYQDGRGNLVGCRRQLEKARRRLAPYTPAHRGVDVAALLATVADADPPGLARLDIPEAGRIQHSSQPGVQPPLAMEEEE
jgi:uncharacterized protein